MEDRIPPERFSKALSPEAPCVAPGQPSMGTQWKTDNTASQLLVSAETVAVLQNPSLTHGDRFNLASKLRRRVIAC